MSHDNRKKPEVRSGDDMNPALATAIKIGGLVVMAALAVVIVFILIELFKKNPEEVVVFKDNHHLVSSDYDILINPELEGGAFEDITNKEIRDILVNLETNEYYIYFYYSSLTSELEDAEITALESLDETFPIFLVDLDKEEFASWLDIQTWQDSLMTNEDLGIILDNKNTNSFILELTIEGRLQETNVDIYFGNGILPFLEDNLIPEA